MPLRLGRGGGGDDACDWGWYWNHRGFHAGVDGLGRGSFARCGGGDVWERNEEQKTTSTVMITQNNDTGQYAKQTFSNG